MTMIKPTLVLYFVFMVAVFGVLHKCNFGGGNNESITDCSRRGKPQHHQGDGKWGC